MVRCKASDDRVPSVFEVPAAAQVLDTHRLSRKLVMCLLAGRPCELQRMKLIYIHCWGADQVVPDVNSARTAFAAAVRLFTSIECLQVLSFREVLSYVLSKSDQVDRTDVITAIDPRRKIIEVGGWLSSYADINKPK